MTDDTILMEDSDESKTKTTPPTDAGSLDGSRKRKKTRRKRKNINVKTLFVGGLPMDAKPREIYLMFRKFTGYQGSILKMQGKEGKAATPVAFVTFESREEAETAKSELHGVRFDESEPKTLKIEFAKSNTKDAENAIARIGVSSKSSDEHPRVIHPPTVPLGDNSVTTTTASMIQPVKQVQPVADDAPVVAWPPVMPPAHMFCDMTTGNLFPTHHHMQQLHLTTYHHHHGCPPPPPTVLHPPIPFPMPTYPPPPPSVYTTPPYTQACTTTFPHSYPPPPPPALQPPPPPPAPKQTTSFIPNPEVVREEDCTPCTTLFVANLEEQVEEEELRQLFSSIPSFQRLKMHKNKGMKPVTFVQYSDLMSAMRAKTLFKGRHLRCAEAGGLRIEYAKKDMGELL